MKYLELAEFVENEIIELGGAIAFPCNVSVNEVTAHYTPHANDEKVFKSGDLVKIDLGAHIDGYIADTAISVLIGEDIPEDDFEKHQNMILASQEGLENARELIDTLWSLEQCRIDVKRGGRAVLRVVHEVHSGDGIQG